MIRYIFLLDFNDDRGSHLYSVVWHADTKTKGSLHRLCERHSGRYGHNKQQESEHMSPFDGVVYADGKMPPLPSLLRLRSIFHRPSQGTNKAIVIFVDLFQTASNPPTDVSALESSISALESAISALEAAIRALDNRSLPWEHAWRWFTGMVIVGVALEWWVIRHDFREEMETWCRRRVAPGFAPSCSHI